MNHFPPRAADQHAVIISDVAAACERHSIPIGALCTALIDLMEAAREAHPFLPPSGEIISRAKTRAESYGACLRSDQRKLNEVLK
jgi:hypothetical protein